MMKLTFLIAGAVCATGLVHAQERAAGGAAETQMSWSALTNQIGTVNTKVEAVNSRVDQIVLCNKKIKLYAPGAEDADADGCITMPFPLETEYVQSNGWVQGPYTLSCTKGRKISMVLANLTTNPNQQACAKGGINCDWNMTSSYVDKTSFNWPGNGSKYLSSVIECK